MTEICELKREINTLRENIDKRDQNAGQNNSRISGTVLISVSGVQNQKSLFRITKFFS